MSYVRQLADIVGYTALRLFRYDQKLLQMDPYSPFTRFWCAVDFALCGKLEDSINVRDAMARDTPDIIFGKFALFLKSAEYLGFGYSPYPLLLRWDPIQRVLKDHLAFQTYARNKEAFRRVYRLD